MKVSCIQCKGRLYCGKSFCPTTQKLHSLYKTRDILSVTDKDSFEGATPTPFVGRYGYPHINLGLLNVQEQQRDAWLYDAPKHWSKNQFNIERIIGLRTSLLNTRSKINAGSAKQSKQQTLQEIKTITAIEQEANPLNKHLIDASHASAMNLNAIETQIDLMQKPRFNLNIDATSLPSGPNAELKRIKIGTIPRIRKAVDKVYSDTDLKATHAIHNLTKKGYDENFITKMISVGTLGQKERRKLVPTRWAITATDDIIGKQIIKQTCYQNSTNDYGIYIGSYLGNYYFILLYPGIWSFELYEMYLPFAGWNQQKTISYSMDYEIAPGRKRYAENCVGGYYASRLPILEHLQKEKRCGGAIAIRIITDEYTCPLGVFVCREATRKAMQSNPIKENSEEEMINRILTIIKAKFKLDVSQLLAQSPTLKYQREQRRIKQY